MSSPLSDLIVSSAGNLIRWSLMALLAFATLTFGGMLPWAGVIIVLVPLGLMLLWLIQAACAGRLEYRPNPLDLPLALFLCLILLQLLIGYPIRLNQPDLGARLLQTAGPDHGRLPFLPGTLDYHVTRWSLLYFLAYGSCCFLVIHTLERREHLSRLLMFIVGLAGAAGIYGLLEYLSGNQGVLGLKITGGGRVRGTFVNPDHFAAFLSMALFAGIGMVMALGTRHRRRRRLPGFSPSTEEEEREAKASLAPVSGPPQERLFQQAFLLFILGLVGTSLVFALSRGAILSALLAGGFVAGMVAIHESLGRRRLLALAALLVIGGFVLWIGLGPVMDRLGQVAVGWADRLKLYRQAIRIVRDFPILGTGLGTFGSIFPRYQAPPLGLDVRYSYAHNDLLQLITDGGIMALAILVLALWGLFREVAMVRILGLSRPAHPWLWPAVRVVGGTTALMAGAITSLGLTGPLFQSPLTAAIGGMILLAAGASPNPTPEMATAGDAAEQAPAVSGDAASRKERSARRRDVFNIGITLGGLGALVAILIHSGVDFSLRIPANALLLSLLVGVTLQAARVRFRRLEAEHLSPIMIFPLQGRQGMLAVVGGVAVVGWLSWVAISAAVAESRVATATAMIGIVGEGQPGTSDRPWVAWTRRSAGARALLEGAVSLDSANPGGHLALGQVYEGLAVRAWNTGLSADGRLLPDPAQRTEETRQLFGKALASLARAAYLAPMDRRVWGEIGWTHGTLARILPGEGAEAHRLASVAAFRRAMALRPNDPHPFQLQADFAFQWAQSQRGRIPYDRLLASDIYQAGIQATQHLVELEVTTLPEALNRMLLFAGDFRVIQAVIPPQAPDFLFAARLLEDQGLSELAFQALERAVALASDEDRPIFFQHLAESFIKRGNLAEAARLLEFVLRLDPQNLDARLMLADALAQQRADERALREHQNAVEVARALTASAGARAPMNTPASEPPPPTRLEIVEAAMRERGLHPAGRRRDPLAKSLAALAGFHQRRGQSNTAIPLWEQALAREPGNSQIRFGYGESLDSLGAWIPAQGEYRRALELDPRNVSLRLRLADTYMRNDLMEQAMTLWQEVTRMQPSNVEARSRLAGLYERLGRRKEAALEYDQILRLQPGNEAARQGLARLRARAEGGS